MRTTMLVCSAAAAACMVGAGCSRQTLPAPAAGQAQGAPPPAAAQITNSLGMRLVSITPGQFVMGNGPGGTAIERDHPVRLTRPYLIGVTEVTQAEWSAVMGSNPSSSKGANLPVTNVTWHEAVEFCRRLSEREGRVYRLPTEAEWEYACRAGTTTAFSFGDGTWTFDEYVWFNKNARGKVQPVGTKKPNPWGLYDMHGNVREWCADWFAWRYPTGLQIDPTGPATGTERVRRGGSAAYFATATASGARDCAPPEYAWDDLGFRVVLEGAP